MFLECAKRFQELETKLDVLINNAGIMGVKTDNRSKQGFEMTFAVNFLGHFLLTMHLIPLLRNAAPARVINLSSLTHSRGRIDFNTLEYWRLLMNENECDTISEYPLYTRSSLAPSLNSVYSNSKLAMVLFSNELSDKLSHAGIVSNALCPGIVATSILEDFGWFTRTFGPPVMKLMTTMGIGVTVETAAKTPLLLASDPEVSGTTTYRINVHSFSMRP